MADKATASARLLSLPSLAESERVVQGVHAKSVKCGGSFEGPGVWPLTRNYVITSRSSSLLKPSVIERYRVG